MGKPALSILDLMPMCEGNGPRTAVTNTIALAEFADQAGYSRYWVGEHHNVAHYGSASPEVLIAAVAGRTKHIRVGSGGVMIRNYPALKVAEQFRLLAALFPGRIDLGVGRSPGADERAARALADGSEFRPNSFEDQLDGIRMYLNGDSCQDDHDNSVFAVPRGPLTLPEMWILGTSAETATIAARRGLPFAFAQFFTRTDAGSAIQAYRDAFMTSDSKGAPRVLVAVLVTCAATCSEARRLGSTVRAWQALRANGREAGLLLYPRQAQSVVSGLPDPPAHPGNVIGDPVCVVHELQERAERWRADEVMLLSLVCDRKARLRSYGLIAETLGL